ncbi:MAG: hypothetical protein ABI577_04575 [bacterium]
MNFLRSEQFPLHRRRKRAAAAGLLASAFLAVVSVGVAWADDPPQPDFYWPYGKVQLDDANISPPIQRVIAIVNGKACGEAQTLIAQAGNGVPAGDVGKTVYVVDVLAAGSNSGHRPGCGQSGDSVVLYFPDAHRFAVQESTFVAGNARVDVDLGPELVFRLQGPMIAFDGQN